MLMCILNSHGNKKIKIRKLQTSHDPEMSPWYEYEVPQYTSCIVRTNPVGAEENVQVQSRVVGLEKPKSAYKEKHFVENYIQSMIDALGLKKKSIVIGGNGDKISQFIADKALKVCSANEITQIYVAKDNLFMMPAISLYIKENNLEGGIYVYAISSQADPQKVNVGIKFLGSNGGSLHEKTVRKILENFKMSTSHKRIGVKFPLSQIQKYVFNVVQGDGKNKTPTQITISVIDGIKDYVAFLKNNFDFPKIRSLISGSLLGEPFRIIVDCREGAAGPYLRAIFEDELGARNSVKNTEPGDCYQKKYFGAEIEYSLPMINEMVLNNQDLGVVIDANGGRSAFFAKGGHFIQHGDTVAVIVGHYHCMPLFQKKTVKGIARTVFSSKAVDPVATKLGLNVVETADGWKLFNSLIDHKVISICNDDDFAMGAYYVGEKDGVLPILGWLSVVAHLRRPVRQILNDLWEAYGRLFRTTLIYENLDPRISQEVLTTLEFLIHESHFVGKSFQVGHFSIDIKKASFFEYKSPVSKSIFKEKAVVVYTKMGRVIIRVMGYDERGDDLQIIVEAYSNGVSPSVDKISMAVPLIKLIMLTTKYPAIISRTDPDRIY